jgi:hypothetical protein
MDNNIASSRYTTLRRGRTTLITLENYSDVMGRPPLLLMALLTRADSDITKMLERCVSLLL